MSVEDDRLRFAHKEYEARVARGICPSGRTVRTTGPIRCTSASPWAGDKMEEVELNGQQVVFVGEARSLWVDLQGSLRDEGMASIRALPPIDRRIFQRAMAVVIGPTVTGSERLAVCREVRSASLASITVISEQLAEVDEMRLVVAGACVIMYPPVRPRVLAAQLANHFHRNQAQESRGVLSYRKFQVDTDERMVTIDGRVVELTPTEFDLLVLLMENPRRVHTHEQISRRLWNDIWTIDHHRLEAHVSRLRKKVLRAGGPAIIGSVRGVGYRLIASVDLSTSSPLAG